MQPKTAILIAAFATTIPAANWLIGHVGTECIPNGPCLLPVGFGLHAPSGVLMVGAALVLRDMVHEAGGIRAALGAILIGGVLAWLVAPPALVVASVAAFLLAELADLAVYAPLRARQRREIGINTSVARLFEWRPRASLGIAILASGAVGAAVDSAVFLWLAFGSLDFIGGQILGKFWMSVAAFVAIAAISAAIQEAETEG